MRLLARFCGVEASGLQGSRELVPGIRHQALFIEASRRPQRLQDENSLFKVRELIYVF